MSTAKLASLPWLTSPPPTTGYPPPSRASDRPPREERGRSEQVTRPARRSVHAVKVPLSITIESHFQHLKPLQNPIRSTTDAAWKARPERPSSAAPVGAPSAAPLDAATTIACCSRIRAMRSNTSITSSVARSSRLPSARHARSTQPKKKKSQRTRKHANGLRASRRFVWI